MDNINVIQAHFEVNHEVGAQVGRYYCKIKRLNVCESLSVCCINESLR